MDIGIGTDFVYSFIGLGVGLVFFGFYLRKEALDFQKDYFDRATETARRIETKFRDRAIELIRSVVHDKDNKLSDEDLKKYLQQEFDKFNFMKEINDLSVMIADAKRLMQDFRRVRTSKNKFANLWFVVGVLVGVNALLAYQVPDPIKILVYLGDMTLVAIAMPMLEAYREYSRAEQRFITKVENEAMTGILNVT
jgi:hypothetical protein